MNADLESNLRRYAAGELAWRSLRQQGLDYSEVLTGLGELGLRPPVATPTGQNGAALQRGITALREALEQHPQP